jgi:hypothetical protein
VYIYIHITRKECSHISLFQKTRQIYLSGLTFFIIFAYKIKIMEVGFANSFWKSLKTMRMHDTWWYKTYDFFRRDLPRFIENIWFFRKELWYFRSWDYSYNLSIFKRSLEKSVHTLEFYGNEIEETRMKKVEKMKRVIELLNHVCSGSYLEIAENELGEIKRVDWDFEPVPEKPELYRLVDNESEEEKKHNRSVYNRADEIENEEWKEIWRILEGQDHEEYKKLYDQQTEDEKHSRDLWKDWFDGSGMKHWWD